MTRIATNPPWRCHCGHRHPDYRSICPYTGIPRDMR